MSKLIESMNNSSKDRLDEHGNCYLQTFHIGFLIFGSMLWWHFWLLWHFSSFLIFCRWLVVDASADTRPLAPRRPPYVWVVVRTNPNQLQVNHSYPNHHIYQTNANTIYPDYRHHQVSQLSYIHNSTITLRTISFEATLNWPTLKLHP